ncbi:MAG: hypothetical protein ACXAD7_00220 [Candidatus Kariarchaeaceae archaeon]|jgi:hypothetical protein
MSNEYHNFAIECKSCHTKWAISLPLTGNIIEAFAAVCECGALIVGNYNSSVDEHLSSEIAKNKKYLTNGHYEILDDLEVTHLPRLELE